MGSRPPRHAIGDLRAAANTAGRNLHRLQQKITADVVGAAEPLRAGGEPGKTVARGVNQVGGDLWHALEICREEIAAAVDSTVDEVESRLRDDARLSRARALAALAYPIRRPMPSGVPDLKSVEPDELTSLFNAYGDDATRADTWTGGDSTYSVRLADGHTLWVFSDTFIGTVNPDGSRSSVAEEGGTTVLISNAFVVQTGDRLHTIYQHGASPRALIEMDRQAMYWAGEPQLVGNAVEVPFREYRGLSRVAGNVLARFHPWSLDQPFDIHELPSETGVAWASAIHRSGRYTYVYGADDNGGTKYLRVARVKGASLRGRWEFLTEHGHWSRRESRAARVLEGVANEFSVSRIGDQYMLLTHDRPEEFSPDIVGYFAPTPVGPFTRKSVLYTTPETGDTGLYGSPLVYTYNAHAHPHIDRGPGRLVVSYNVNAERDPAWRPGDPLEVYDDASIYRPRFITLEFDV